METGRFRFFADREDLTIWLSQIQSANHIYCVPTFSIDKSIVYKDLTELHDLGINTTGHTIERQFMIFPEELICIRTAHSVNDNGIIKTKWDVSFRNNSGCILFQPGGIYQDKAVFCTEISTMCYDDPTSKKLFNCFKNAAARYSVKTVNGAFIGKSVYKNKNIYRFCTINYNSPSEYDLIVE